MFRSFKLLDCFQVNENISLKIVVHILVDVKSLKITGSYIIAFCIVILQHKLHHNFFLFLIGSFTCFFFNCEYITLNKMHMQFFVAVQSKRSYVIPMQSHIANRNNNELTIISHWVYIFF